MILGRTTEAPHGYLGALRPYMPFVSFGGAERAAEALSRVGSLGHEGEWGEQRVRSLQQKGTRRISLPRDAGTGDLEASVIVSPRCHPSLDMQSPRYALRLTHACRDHPECSQGLRYRPGKTSEGSTPHTHLSHCMAAPARHVGGSKERKPCTAESRQRKDYGNPLAGS